MSIFSRKATSNRRRAARKHSQLSRRLRLESLEGRRLLSADVTQLMAGGHHDGAEHTGAVIVTETSILTHHDTIPRFGANPTNIAVADGRWSEASTWSTGQVPGADDVVSIPSGVAVTYDVESQLELDVVEVSGRLDFATDVDTSLWLNELMVMPSGTLTIGTEYDPVAASVTAEIVITDTPGSNGLHYKTGTVDQPGIDPNQWGNGILGFGTIEVHGQEKTSSYIRLAEEPLAGDRVLVLESEPLGWQPGDELVLPDTRSDWSASRIEELTVQSVDGNRVTLTEPLALSHSGPRATAGGAPLMLPHIGNLTRNVVIRSESPAGVRGHVAFMSKADVQVSYARFKDLGRTTVSRHDVTTYDSAGQVKQIARNHVGRYAMHFHHVEGPQNLEDAGYQFEVIGNAIDGALRWAVTVHGSHYGLIKDNFAYNYQGAGFVTENGTEAYNHFEGNFAVLGTATNDFKVGNAGEGFWFRGPLTSAVDNVAVNQSRAGFVHFAQDLHGANRSDWPKPAFRGADMEVASQVVQYNVYHTPILEFEGNEVYASGSVFDSWINIPEDRQHLNSLTGWNTRDDHFSISSYNNRNLVVDGAKIIGDLTRLNPNTLQKYQPISEIGIEAVRASENLTIRNSEIRGVQTGYKTPAFAPSDFASYDASELLISDSVIQAYTGVLINAMTRSKRMGQEGKYARLVIENTRFERMPENLAQPDQYAVYMNFILTGNITRTNEVFLYDFNGVKGANYRVYYPQQAPNFVVPMTSSSVIGSPQQGLTNAETWERYGVAVGGAVAPSREYDGDNGETALARGRALGIHGLVFPLEGEPARNEAPLVSAGGAMTVEQYRQIRLAGVVTDDGLATGAAQGTAHVDWSKLRGPGEVHFSNAGLANTVAMFTDPGTYVLRLTASDGLRESYSDVTVTVLAASNRAPVVDAGRDIVLNDSNRVTLRGTASDDGNPHGYLETQWRLISGPGAVNISSPTSLITDVQFNAKGIYVLELRADDGELTSSDQVVVTVNHAMPVSPLLVHLEMNDLQTTDSSQHALHGENANISLSEGKFGSAVHFAGNSHIALPSTDFLQPKHGLTASVWVRPAVTDGAARPVLVWDGGSWDAYKLTLANGQNTAILNASVAVNGNTGMSVTTASLPSDRWTHLALTYSADDQGGVIKLYRDGQLIGESEAIGGPLTYKHNSASRLTLGKEHPTSNGAGFIGAMDDLYVYDYALSPSELAHLMMGHAPHVQHAPPHAHPHAMQVLDGPLNRPLEQQLQLPPAGMSPGEFALASALTAEASDHPFDRAAVISPASVFSGDRVETEPWSEKIDAALSASFDVEDWGV